MNSLLTEADGKNIKSSKDISSLETQLQDSQVCNDSKPPSQPDELEEEELYSAAAAATVSRQLLTLITDVTEWSHRGHSYCQNSQIKGHLKSLKVLKRPLNLHAVFVALVS